MPTEQQIKKCLDNVLIPGVMRSLVRMNLLRSITINDSKVGIILSSTALAPVIQNNLEKSIQKAVSKTNDISEVKIEFVDGKAKDINQVERVIAVMSGKGGVGKSLITSLLAVTLRRQGKEVGILDADITGPSIPKMFGVNGRLMGTESGIMPVPSRSGIEVMSINLLLSDEDEAVIWRGPLIGRTITQFWEDVFWGSLDYLLVDLPPGTADAPLTVMQNLPISGMIVVFTPQDLTNMVVRKAVKMAQRMEKPILGVVENMSYLYLSEVDKKMEIFGRSRSQEMAQTANAPLLAQLPIDPELAKLCDEGNIERYDSKELTVLYESFRDADLAASRSS